MLTSHELETALLFLSSAAHDCIFLFLDDGEIHAVM